MLSGAFVDLINTLNNSEADLKQTVSGRKISGKQSSPQVNISIGVAKIMSTLHIIIRAA